MRPKLLSQLKRRTRRSRVEISPTRHERRLIRPTKMPPYKLQNAQLATLHTDDLVPAWRMPSDKAFRSVMKEVHPRVWAGPVFTPEWCEKFLNEVQHYRAWAADSASVWSVPNSMHQQGILLAELGLDALVEEWMRTQLQPIAQSLLPEHVWGDLVECHAYVVEYSPETQGHLGFHVDDSQVTLNLCLGEQFDGSDLYFEGPRCALHVDTPSQATERFTWTHQPGVAVLHAGKNRHGVHPIQSGRRWSLISWFRDATGRDRWECDWEQTRCPDWCDTQPSARDR